MEIGPKPLSKSRLWAVILCPIAVSFGLVLLISYIEVYVLGNFDPKFQAAPRIAFEISVMVYSVFILLISVGYLVGLATQWGIVQELPLRWLASMVVLSTVLSWAFNWACLLLAKAMNFYVLLWVGLCLGSALSTIFFLLIADFILCRFSVAHIANQDFGRK